MGAHDSSPVLLVASDSALTTALAQMLRGAGFESERCSSPHAARPEARAHHAEVALIDLPGQLPDAITTATDLRADGVASIVIGGSELQRMGTADRHVGPDAVLIRPFTSSHLSCVINVVCLLSRIDALVAAATTSTLEGDLAARIRALAEARRATTVLCGAGGGAHCVYPGLDLLSPREAEIARWLLQGQRVPAISRRLSISPHTVRNHIKAMFRKFSVHSQAELVDRLMGQASA